jgi:hypothetical protein
MSFYELLAISGRVPDPSSCGDVMLEFGEAPDEAAQSQWCCLA